MWDIWNSDVPIPEVNAIALFAANWFICSSWSRINDNNGDTTNVIFLVWLRPSNSAGNWYVNDLPLYCQETTVLNENPRERET